MKIAFVKGRNDYASTEKQLCRRKIQLVEGSKFITSSPWQVAWTVEALSTCSEASWWPIEVHPRRGDLSFLEFGAI